MRPDYHSSASISRSIDASLKVSGLTKEDLDLHCIYSFVDQSATSSLVLSLMNIRCFPIVPKFAANHLGLTIEEPEKPLTLIGGLTSFGGAGNNYSMHSFTEMVRQLRKGNGKNGMVLANGGVATYQHVVCLSSQPRTDGSVYPPKNPLPAYVDDLPVPKIATQAEGEATIEVCYRA